MDPKEVLLKEWEQRYESYRSYRGQYLNVLSLSLTAWLVAIGYVASNFDRRFACLIILSVVVLVMCALILAHYIARAGIKALGRRLDSLQKELGMAPFPTTRLLERALVVTLVGSWGALAITVILVGYVALSPTPGGDLLDDHMTQLVDQQDFWLARHDRAGDS